jgi:hypothetical protein
MIAVTVAASILAGGLVTTEARATLLIGSSHALFVGGDDFGIDCGSADGECTLSPARPTGRDTSPVNGRVIRWGVQVDGGAPYVRLRVIAPGPTFARSGLLHPSPEAGRNEFAESLPISLGDRIGVDDPGPGYVEVSTGRPGFAYSSFIPAPDGSPAHGTEESDAELLLYAWVEPDNGFTVIGPTKPVRGNLLLRVAVPNRGLLEVRSTSGVNGERGKGIVRRVVWDPPGPGQIGIPLALTSAGRRAFKVGKASGRVSLAYTPIGGTTATQSTRITLRRKPRR